MSNDPADIGTGTTDDAGLFGAAATGLVVGAAEVATMALVGPVAGPIAGAIVSEAAGHVTQKILGGLGLDDADGVLAPDNLHSVSNAPLSLLDAPNLSTDPLQFDPAAFDSDAHCELAQTEPANASLEAHESLDF